MTTEQVLDTASKGGVVALLLAIIVGNLRGWWVSGGTYQAMKAERDQWRNFAFRSRDLARLQAGLEPDVLPDGLDTGVGVAR